MESQVKKYEKYSGAIKRMLLFAGVWPDLNKAVKVVLASLAIFSTFLAGLGALNFCIHNASNVMILTKDIGLVISLFSATLKVHVSKARIYGYRHYLNIFI